MATKNEKIKKNEKKAVVIKILKDVKPLAMHHM